RARPRAASALGAGAGSACAFPGLDARRCWSRATSASSAATLVDSSRVSSRSAAIAGEGRSRAEARPNRNPPRTPPRAPATQAAASSARPPAMSVPRPVVLALPLVLARLVVLARSLVLALPLVLARARLTVRHPAAGQVLPPAVHVHPARL